MPEDRRRTDCRVREREDGVGSGVLGKWREASTEDETAEWLVWLECMAGRGDEKG